MGLASEHVDIRSACRSALFGHPIGLVCSKICCTGHARHAVLKLVIFLYTSCSCMRALGYGFRPHMNQNTFQYKSENKWSGLPGLWLFGRGQRRGGVAWGHSHHRTSVNFCVRVKYPFSCGSVQLHCTPCSFARLGERQSGSQTTFLRETARGGRIFSGPHP